LPAICTGAGGKRFWQSGLRLALLFCQAGG
jgi:hypothetical protein